MNNTVLFVVPYPYDKAPSQRLKFEQYYNVFEKAGFSVRSKPFFNARFWKIVYLPGHLPLKFILTIAAYVKRYALLLSVRKYDIVYVHLWGTPLGLPVYEYLLRKLSKKIVYDIDDLVYLNATNKNNKIIELLKSGSKINFLLKNADSLFVSTDKLKEYALKFNNNINYIPATIDVKRYPVAEHHNNKITIGWSGSATTSKYLHLLDNVLKKISAKYDVKITVMGDPDLSIPGLAVDLIQWSPISEISTLMSFDIGIHPLPDEEWVYGKSGGKLVQYMAAGIPIVASAIGPNYIAVKDGYNGFLAKDELEWFSKLSLLIEDPSLRREMGENSRKLAIKEYSVEANADKYLRVFDLLIK